MWKKTRRLKGLGTIRNNSMILVINANGILYAKGMKWDWSNTYKGASYYKQKKRIGNVFRRGMKALGISSERTLIKKGVIK